jgi:hypothetical protein
MGRSPARRAANEAMFRAANERIEDSAANLDLTASPIPFICECDDERCTQIIRLSVAEYEQVRSDPRRFFVSPGHQSEPDRVVEEAERFATVEKTGQEGRLVAGQDPRASPG